MITITLEKSEYDKLAMYQEAFRKNECIISTSFYKRTTIATRGKSDILSDLVSENLKLQEEINILKNRKWWQKL